MGVRAIVLINEAQHNSQGSCLPRRGRVSSSGAPLKVAADASSPQERTIGSLGSVQDARERERSSAVLSAHDENEAAKVGQPLPVCETQKRLDVVRHPKAASPAVR